MRNHPSSPPEEENCSFPGRSTSLFLSEKEIFEVFFFFFPLVKESPLGATFAGSGHHDVLFSATTSLKQDVFPVVPMPVSKGREIPPLVRDLP